MLYGMGSGTGHTDDPDATKSNVDLAIRKTSRRDRFCDGEGSLMSEKLLRILRDPFNTNLDLILNVLAVGAVLFWIGLWILS